MCAVYLRLSWNNFDNLMRSEVDLNESNLDFIYLFVSYSVFDFRHSPGPRPRVRNRDGSDADGTSMVCS
jgi:hypothetical protein